MSEGRRHREPHFPLFGILLVFVGVILLLQTSGVLPWSLWNTLWRFWPVLIIIVGLRIVLGRLHPWLVSLLILAILGACFAIAISMYRGNPGV